MQSSPARGTVLALSLLSLEPKSSTSHQNYALLRTLNWEVNLPEAQGGLFLLKSKRESEEDSKGTPIILMVLLRSIAD